MSFRPLLSPHRPLALCHPRTCCHTVSLSVRREREREAERENSIILGKSKRYRLSRKTSISSNNGNSVNKIHTIHEKCLLKFFLFAYIPPSKEGFSIMQQYMRTYLSLNVSPGTGYLVVASDEVVDPESRLVPLDLRSKRDSQLRDKSKCASLVDCHNYNGR